MRHNVKCVQVDLSIINGDVVVKDGKLLTLDVAALIKEHNIVSERICNIILRSGKQAQS